MTYRSYAGVKKLDISGTITILSSFRSVSKVAELVVHVLLEELKQNWTVLVHL